MENNKDNENQISAPVVLFCGNCRAIFGDSYSWVSSEPELYTITLYDKTDEVIVNEELETSKQGFDLGSTFTTMSCRSCQTYIGKVYKTTTRSLDKIRDMYTFSANKVSVHQLGPSKGSLEFFSMKTEEWADLPSLSKMQYNMRLAQNLICGLSERVSKLEEELSKYKQSESSIFTENNESIDLTGNALDDNVESNSSKSELNENNTINKGNDKNKPSKGNSIRKYNPKEVVKSSDSLALNKRKTQEKQITNDNEGSKSNTRFVAKKQIMKSYERLRNKK